MNRAFLAAVALWLSLNSMNSSAEGAEDFVFTEGMLVSVGKWFPLHQCESGYRNFDNGTPRGLFMFCFDPEDPAVKIGTPIGQYKGRSLFRCDPTASEKEKWINSFGGALEGVSPFCVNVKARPMVVGTKVGSYYNGAYAIYRCPAGYYNLQSGTIHVPSGGSDGVSPVCIPRTQ